MIGQNRAEKKQNFYAESYDEASNEFTSEGGLLPIASAIYPNDDIYGNEFFPYGQQIRGNGACYFNASIVGILNKCVSNEQRWQIFKTNIGNISQRAKNLINQIEQRARGSENEGLDLENLNIMLQEKGENNLGTLLVKEILIPKHQELIDSYEDKILLTQILIESTSRTDSDKIKNLNEIIKVYETYQRYLQKARENDFATSYEEASVYLYVTELTRGMGENGGSLEIHTMNEDYVRSCDELLSLNPHDIYLYNHCGGAHFNLWYSNLDPIIHRLTSNNEISKIRKLEKQTTDQSEFTKLKNIIQNNENFKSNAFGNEITEIMGGVTIDDLKADEEGLVMLTLINSILEFHDKATTLLPQENAYDPNICFELAKNEITKNQTPTENFQTYLNGLGQDSLTDKFGGTLSHYVAMCGKEGFIDIVIEKLNNSLKIKDNTCFGNTPLIWAIANAKNQFVYTLLNKLKNKNGPTQTKQIVDIDQISKLGTNALHLACAKGYINQDSVGNQVSVPNADLVKILIECEANPNIHSKGLTALDIVVLRGSIEMVQAILGSPQIEVSTILKAINLIDKEAIIVEKNNNLLKKICQPILDVTPTDISKDKINCIKDLLKTKLREIDPHYEALEKLKDSITKKVMEIKKQSIERGLIKDSPGFQSSITKVLREFSKEFPIATSVCQTICRAELSIDLPKQNPNNFLTIYKENQQIIEFKTISLYNTKNKFDYKKNLSPAHEFKPEEYSKEKERDRIIDMLQKAK